MRSWKALPILGGLVGAFAMLASPPSHARVEQRVEQLPGAEQLTIHSAVLGEERTVLVRLPEGYEHSAERYPVLYVLDAEYFFQQATSAVQFLSELGYEGGQHPIPEMIVVGVVNVDRNRDYTPTRAEAVRNMKFPTSGGATKFRRFLVDEVLPAIDSAYRTTPYRILAGWSLGGLFTVDTLLNEPSAFAGYLAVSPSLWWDDQLAIRSLPGKKLADGPAEAKDLVITLGTAERETMVANSTNEFMRVIGESPLPNVSTELVPIEGLGHNYSPAMAFFMGLATLFADWNPPAEILDHDLAFLEAHYASMSARYHFTIPVPEDAFSKLGWKLFEAGRKDESGVVFRTWVERYPQSAVANASMGSYYRENGDRDLAAAFLRKGLELEEQSAHPRPDFIGDLQRDIDALADES